MIVSLVMFAAANVEAPRPRVRQFWLDSWGGGCRAVGRRVGGGAGGGPRPRCRCARVPNCSGVPLPGACRCVSSHAWVRRSDGVT